MKRAGDLITQLFSNIDSKDLKLYGDLFSSWSSVAGTDIAAHSRILELNRGVLYIGVDHPGWMQMIGMQKQQILKNLTSRYLSLEIRDLRLMLIDGVPEEELEKRFNIEEIASPDPAGGNTPPAQEAPPEEQSPAEPPAEFRKKLERLGQSIEEKWK